MTRSPNFLAAACIVLAAAAMFPTLRNGFTTWDDPQYILENTLVRGLSPGSVVTMFTTPEVAGNYHPVTLVAIAAQYAAFGASPFGYHLVSLLLHCLATLLVYKVADRLTGSGTAAFFAAALFGVHPLHLEPVAWLADQKDLLSTGFFLGAVLFFLEARKPGNERLLLRVVLPLFALAVLSKATAVALPLVLLALDYRREGKITRAALREKIPFFAIALAAGFLAFRAQAAAGAIADVEVDTTLEKLLYASYGYVMYIVKLVVPFGTSPWHPYPTEPPGYFWAFPAVALGILAVAFVKRRQAPLVFLGVAWYTITVAPVLQFVQVGNAMMADRYAYLSSVGLLVTAGWGFDRLAEKFGASKGSRGPTLLGGVYVIVLAALTFALAPVWRDGVSLWTRVIDRYPASAKGWFNRGHAYHVAGKFREAVADYDRTLQLTPGYPFARSNRGLSRLFMGDKAGALADFDAELGVRPAETDVRFWRASVLGSIGRFDEAVADLTAVLEAKPGNYEATVRRGLVYTASRDFSRAEADFNAAIAARPGMPDLYFNRANVRAGMERWNDAIADYSTVLKMNPSDRDAFYARGIASFMGRDTASACADLRRASALGSPAADTAIAEICVR